MVLNEGLLDPPLINEVLFRHLSSTLSYIQPRFMYYNERTAVQI